MNTPADRDLEKTLEAALNNASRWDGSPQVLYQKVRRRLRPQPWYRRFRPAIALGAAALTLVLSLGVYQYAGAPGPGPLDDHNPPAVIPGEPPADTGREALPVVGTQEKLQELVDARRVYRGMKSAAEHERIGSWRVESQLADQDSGYSETNTQVRGVDEADIVKTDGTYLYQVRNRELVISRIDPAEQMQVVSRTPFAETYDPQDLYLDGDLVTVIAGKRKTDTHRWESGDSVVFVYDISRKQAPVQIREVEVEGEVLSTRKAGSVVYLVAQKWLTEDTLDEPGISYRDSAERVSKKLIGLESIRYFPGIRHDAYLTVLALDVSDGRQDVEVDVYLGSGREIYMSKENLYIALAHWDSSTATRGGTAEKTLVHKFGIAGTDIAYQGMGEVPGTILNQFSMDEHNGTLRIATTSRDKETTNNVYILDGEMNVAGRLEGLAPGERIYSARFMGDKGYLVTFEMIDPLFVIDLKDPANPRVLGELKIPGFSSYLHPLDDTTLLGIGHDTDIVVQNGRPTVRVGGIKLAIFDVADVANPRELHVEIIGEQGSHSEALDNHKAVLFYNGVLALPVTAYENGRKEFQGAAAYHVTKENGFSPIGRVSHLDYNPYDFDYMIRRSLIINNLFYSVSNETIKANRLVPGLPEVGALSLK
ncbi:MAG: beta-propeller domain-containing protein [Bacillota bacterium]|nr:beta-propeller domain-containing protein [Bacillota bacterium]MDW7685251.1 beta-propeller domain-containing protein [Bacillota bacterium]